MAACEGARCRAHQHRPSTMGRIHSKLPPLSVMSRVRSEGYAPAAFSLPQPGSGRAVYQFNPGA